MSTWAYPFRLQLQRNLSDLLKTITPTNGYVSDLSDDTSEDRIRSRIARGRGLYGEDDPIPLVVIQQPPVPDDGLTIPVASPIWAGPWTLVLQGFVDDDPENASDPGEILMADVRNCLAKHRDEKGRYEILDLGTKSPGVREAGSNIQDMHIGPGVVRTSNDISQYSFFWLFLGFDIVENLRKPYG